MVIIMIITRQNFNQVTIILIIVILSPSNNYDYYMAKISCFRHETSHLYHRNDPMKYNLELKIFAAFRYISVYKPLHFTGPSKSFAIIECALFNKISRHRKELLVRHIIVLLTNINVYFLKIC